MLKAFYNVFQIPQKLLKKYYYKFLTCYRCAKTWWSTSPAN